MLNNIKSNFIVKMIFIHLYDRTRLNLIKYNKMLQNKINIKLYNYKIFSGRHIEYETDGKGKEYNYKGEFEFEGEYLNGERNGNGKEYDDDELKFEGEYLNGKRNGKGKEYDYDGSLKFEGEYLNGKEWNGKGFNENNEIEYELNNGKGIMKRYYDNGQLEFKGEY